MTTCEGCRSREQVGKTVLCDVGGIGFVACRKCAGRTVQQLLAFIRQFDALWPSLKRPRNHALPITDIHGQHRCRHCEVKIDWQRGASPFCPDCISPVMATPVPGSQSNRASHT